MDDHAIRELLVEVRAGGLARRSFVQTMAGLGLVGPLATHLLATVGVAQAEGRAPSTPSKRGGGGQLKALWWDAPNLLNPLLAVGLKDWKRVRRLLRAARGVRSGGQHGAGAGPGSP